MVITADSSNAGVGSLNGINGHQSATRKPRLLVCASPVTGHTTPIIRVASELADRGYDITFLAGEEFHDSITKFGGKPVTIPPIASEESWITRNAIPVGIERLLYDMEHYFIEPTQSRMEYLYKTLEAMNEADPTWPIVIVTESFFMGSHPMYLGAPLPKGFTARPRVVNIHAVAYATTSQDAGPMGLAMLPPSSDEDRAQIQAIYDQLTNGTWKTLIDYEQKVMTDLGAADYVRPTLPFDTWTLSHDVTLQMCPRSVEYPRSDVPAKIKFAGALTPRPMKKDFVYPSFWGEVTSGEKKVVVVAQGTVALEYDHLIIPTMRALAGREDVLVVGILGAKGAALPDDVTVPANARVIDYLHYDAILPYAAAFVMNAGYGGFTHGLVNGVPMVLGGDSEDKPEVALRAEWSGVAVNLKTGQPSVERLTEAVGKVIDDDRYKKRVMEIKKENEEMKAMDTVEKTILELAALG